MTPEDGDLTEIFMLDGQIVSFYINEEGGNDKFLKILMESMSNPNPNHMLVIKRDNRTIVVKATQIGAASFGPVS
jgi:hypothetical protein